MSNIRNLEASALRAIRYAKQNNTDVYISDSGGVDSVVISHIGRRCGIVRAHFFNTGVETKENIKFMKSKKNVTWHTPKQTFKDFCFEHGFPIGSKEVTNGISEITNVFKNLNKNNVTLAFKRLTGSNCLGKNDTEIRTRYSLPLWAFEAIVDNLPITSKCCNVLKKDIRDKINKYAITGEMSEESMLRKTNFKIKGLFQKNKVTPIANWTKEDVWAYIRKYNLKYSKIYDLGAKRTGCIQCDTSIYFRVKNGEDFMALEKKLYPKQYKASLKLKHKTGVTFFETVKAVENIMLYPNSRKAHSKKLEMMLSLKKVLEENNMEYNKVILGTLIAYSRKQIAKAKVGHQTGMF